MWVDGRKFGKAKRILLERWRRKKNRGRFTLTLSEKIQGLIRRYT